MPYAPSRRVRRVPTGVFVRSFAMGALAIGGASLALVRHCTHEPPPLREPVPPRPSPTYDEEAGEMPVPELLAPSQTAD